MHIRIAEIDHILIIATVVVTFEKHICGDEGFASQSHRHVQGILASQFDGAGEFYYVDIK